MTQGPWYITVAAVKELMAIKGLRVADDGPDFEACEDELIAQARAIVDGGKSGRELDSGAIQYRGGRPLRLRLTVNPAPRREGGKPQLVRVQPDHEGRAGPYTRSRPERQTGNDKRRDERDGGTVRRGGPSGAPGVHRNPSYPLRASADERAAWERAAKAAGQSLSDWIRDALARASK